MQSLRLRLTTVIPFNPNLWRHDLCSMNLFQQHPGTDFMWSKFTTTAFQRENCTGRENITSNKRQKRLSSSHTTMMSVNPKKSQKTPTLSKQWQSKTTAMKRKYQMRPSDPDVLFVLLLSFARCVCWTLLLLIRDRTWADHSGFGKNLCLI